MDFWRITLQLTAMSWWLLWPWHARRHSCWHPV